MNILFLHSHFPGHFSYLAEFFGKEKKNTTLFVTTDISRKEYEIPGVKRVVLAEKPENEGELETPLKAPPAVPVANLLADLKRKGFEPDIVIGRSGDGMTLYVKDVFPNAPFISFFEWYHRPDKLKDRFEEGSAPDLNVKLNLRNKNMPILADLVSCNVGVCPMAWQKEQFPREFMPKLAVIPHGVDTNRFKPKPGAAFKIEGLDLSGSKELITYTVNLLAPYLGFDQFIDALPTVLEKKDDAQVVIVGLDRVSFGDKEGNKKSYKSMILDRVDLDLDRVHFIDQLPLEDYRLLLQSSSVHVYIDSPLTVTPALFEAMACECLVVASDIMPVKEVIKDGKNGFIADFSSSEIISEKIINCLDFPSLMGEIKTKARQTITKQYALDKTVNGQLQLIKQVIDGHKKKSKKKADSPGQFG